MIRKEGWNCLRFLSRLWWLNGNRKNAEKFGEQAIEISMTNLITCKSDGV